MRIYDCKQPYFSGLSGEPVPHWPQDYDLAGEVAQGELQGNAALEHAFTQALNGRRLRVGDVVRWRTGAYTDARWTAGPGSGGGGA